MRIVQKDGGGGPQMRKGPSCRGTNLGKVEEREDKEI